MANIYAFELFVLIIGAWRISLAIERVAEILERNRDDEDDE